MRCLFTGVSGTPLNSSDFSAIPIPTAHSATYHIQHIFYKLFQILVDKDRKQENYFL